MITGAVDLTGAHISGQLVLSGSTITHAGVAVAADGLVVDGDFYCRDDAHVEGEVSMVAARIGGELRFTTSTLSNPGAVALRADRAVVEKDLYCRERFAADGEVRLHGAHVKGQVNFNRATLHNPQGVALDADQLVVGSHLYCHDKFHAEGEVRLVAARVGGEVRFSDSTIAEPRRRRASGPSGSTWPTTCTAARSSSSTARSTVRGAHVAGQLNFNNATIRNPGGTALLADELVVGAHLYCQQGFVAEGRVSLVAARVGGEVRFSASHFANPGGVAIHAPRFAVGGDMYCRERLSVDGEIDLTGAQVGGQLNFNRAACATRAASPCGRTTSSSARTSTATTTSPSSAASRSSPPASAARCGSARRRCRTRTTSRCAPTGCSWRGDMYCREDLRWTASSACAARTSPGSSTSTTPR